MLPAIPAQRKTPPGWRGSTSSASGSGTCGRTHPCPEPARSNRRSLGVPLHDPDELEPIEIPLDHLLELPIRELEPGDAPDVIEAVRLFPDSGRHHLDWVLHWSSSV